jgi:hypothetical protein
MVDISNIIAPLASIDFPYVNLQTETKITAQQPNFKAGTVKEIELDHGIFDVERPDESHVKYRSEGKAANHYYFLI